MHVQVSAQNVFPVPTSSSYSHRGQNFSSYCRFGDQIVESVFTSTDVIACVLPPLKRTYEVQTLKFGLTPFLPTVQNLVVATPANAASMVTLNVSAGAMVNQIEEIRVNSTGAHAVQEIKLTQTLMPPFEALISVKEQGTVREIQSIQSTLSVKAERQVA